MGSINSKYEGERLFGLKHGCGFFSFFFNKIS